MRLIAQFLTESIVIGLISLTAAILIIFLIQAPLNDVLNEKIIPDITALGAYFTVILFTTIIIGILSGIYPAFVLAGFNPIKALKNNLKLNFSRNTIGKTLMIVQFLISIGLIITTLVGMKQMDFIRNKSLGV
jgi:putative ABC transport system permease protein